MKTTAGASKQDNRQCTGEQRPRGRFGDHHIVQIDAVAILKQAELAQRQGVIEQQALAIHPIGGDQSEIAEVADGAVNVVEQPPVGAEEVIFPEGVGPIDRAAAEVEDKFE